jgi:hypothetical protein
MFKNGFVFDLNYEQIKFSHQNIKWLKNEVKSDRFPIFPWDIDPQDYNTILANHKRLK